MTGWHREIIYAVKVSMYAGNRVSVGFLAEYFSGHLDPVSEQIDYFI